MSYRLVYLALSLCILAIACQEPTKQVKTPNNLYADYFLRYLQSEQQLRAEVSFMEGDSLETAKAITFPSVFFQKGAMEVKDLGQQGIRYKAERSGQPRSNYDFKFKDETGQERSYSLALAAIDSFYIDGKASLSNGLNIKWQGTPLSENERLVLMLTDKDNKANVLQIDGPTTESAIAIPTTKLKGMAPGLYSTYLVRKQYGQQENNLLYTKYTTEYYTRSVSFTLSK